MKLIYIQWEDAIANSSWKSKSELDKWVSEDNMIIEEVGWVYEETKKYIVLVSRISKWNHNENDVEFGLTQKIPKTWIRKRKILAKHII